jgi:group I intron endonuclease
MIIYKIKNNINNKIYIGLTTKDLSKRIAEHVSENRSYIQKALNKYGIQSFNVSVIDSAESREILCEKERYWIQHYNCKVPNGYNLTDGGDGLVNPSEIVRKRISDTLKKKHLVTKGFTGRKHTEESKRKTSESCRKTLAFPEIRKKMSDAGKGRRLSGEHKLNISKGKKGKKRTDVVWNKGKKNTQIPWNKDHNHPSYKAWRERLIHRNKSGH